MKVVIDCRMIQNSGIGRYLRNLLPDILSQAGHSFVLLGNPKALEPYRSEKVDIVSLCYSVYHPFQHIEMFLKVPKCDVLFAPHFPTSFFPLRAKKRITTIHDVFHISNQSDFKGFKKWYARFLYRTAMKRSFRLITVSENSKRELLKYSDLPHSDIQVIYNYIDRERFFVLSAGEREKQSLKLQDKLGLDKNTPFLLFVGNIKAHKNIVRMVRAFELLKNTQIHLLIVGDQKGFLHQLPEFDELVNKNHRILFTGKLKDDALLLLYNTAKALIFPSLYEGFGYPPLEAMACGTVTLASDIPVVHEVYGETVLYFDPLSEVDMAEKIDYFLEHSEEKEKLSSGFELLLNRYGRLKHVKRYCKAVLE